MRKKPYKKQGSPDLPLKIFLCGTPFFRQTKSSSLEQGGVCFLFSQSLDKSMQFQQKKRALLNDKQQFHGQPLNRQVGSLPALHQ